MSTPLAGAGSDASPSTGQDATDVDAEYADSTASALALLQDPASSREGAPRIPGED